MNVLIRLKEGYAFKGEGERLGLDYLGQEWFFWKSSGQLEVPVDLALRLEREVPQRYEMVDRVLADQFLGLIKEVTKTIHVPTPAPSPAPVLEMWASLSKLDGMTKDELNDWAAVRGYDVNPGRQNRPVMLKKLKEQVEAKTGRKVE